MGPDTFFCRTSQWGYATPRPPPRSSRDRNLQPGYKPQKSENYYQDDDHHYDKDQVTGAHSSTSQRRILRERLSLEEGPKGPSPTIKIRRGGGSYVRGAATAATGSQESRR